MNRIRAPFVGTIAAGFVLSLGLAAPASAAPDPMRVGTYNIKDPDSTQAAPWDQRAPLIAQNIVEEQLDVVGIQEVYEKKDRESFMRALNSAAGGVYEMTFPEKDASGYDNRIVYNAQRIGVVTTGDYPYATQSPGDPIRHMVWALLENRANGGRFLYVTTHLCPESDPVTKAQWKELLGQAVGLRNTFGVPVIAVGDYNSTKFERPSRRMLKKMYKAGIGDVLGQTFRSYTTFRPRVTTNRIDAWLGSSNRLDPFIPHWSVGKRKNSNSIDWIFASNQLQVQRYRVFARYVGKYLTAPIPSDHNLVTATIVLP